MATTTNKARCWSITINNPTEADQSRIQLLSSERWFKGWNGQIEKGKEGTEHIQGMLRTDSVRFAQIKKALPRAHIEIARNEKALEQYVSKAETRVAEMPAITVFDPKVISKRIADEIYNQIQEQHGTEAARNWFLDDRYEHAGIQSYWDKLDALFWLDRIAVKLIKEGHYVEMYAANPAVRAAYKLYFRAMIIRDVRAQNTHDKAEIAHCPGASSDCPSADESETGYSDS